MSYSDKLKDPRWQRKRLEIMQRDNWRCRHCGESEKMLAVHHRRYDDEPWDTPNEFLITLCEVCHTTEHEWREGGEKKFFKAFYEAGFLIRDLIPITLALREYNFFSLPHHPEILGEILGRIIRDPDKFKEVIDSYLEPKKLSA